MTLPPHKNGEEGDVLNLQHTFCMYNSTKKKKRKKKGERKIIKKVNKKMIYSFPNKNREEFAGYD